LQKTCLNAAAEQTSEWFSACKKTAGAFPVPGPAFFFDFAGQTLKTWIETQKSAIDLVVEQNQAVVDIARERTETYAKITAGATAAFQNTVAQTVEAQKKVLDLTGAQTKTVFAAAKKVAGPAVGIVDTVEGGINTVIETQKSFLEATTKPFVA
jgi:predicted phage tail protein